MLFLPPKNPKKSKLGLSLLCCGKMGGVIRLLSPHFHSVHKEEVVAGVEVYWSAVGACLGNWHIFKSSKRSVSWSKVYFEVYPPPKKLGPLHTFFCVRNRKVCFCRINRPTMTAGLKEMGLPNCGRASLSILGCMWHRKIDPKKVLIQKMTDPNVRKKFFPCYSVSNCSNVRGHTLSMTAISWPFSTPSNPDCKMTSLLLNSMTSLLLL